MTLGKNRRSVLQIGLWSLTWPIFVETLLSFTLGLEDSLYLAKVSSYAAGAVGAVLPVLGLCSVAFQTLAQSGASVASQLIGGGRHERVDPSFVALVLVNGALGAVFALLVLAFHRVLGRWLGLGPHDAAVAAMFLRLAPLILFFAALRFACAAIINARGQTRFNMVSALLVNLTNLGLNHLLTRGTWGLPRLGVTGVASSTVIAQAVGLLFSGWVVYAALGIRWPPPPTWRSLKTTLAPILAIALPSVIEPLSWNLNQLVLVGLVVSLGDVALAARTYTLNLTVIAVVWSFSLGLGTQLKIAHLVGAGRFDEARAQLSRSLRWALPGVICIMLLLGASARPLYGLFTQDGAVVRLGQVLVLLGLALEPSRTANLIVGGSLRGSGDATYVSRMSVLLTWGIAIPAAYVLVRWLHLGLVGVWLAMLCDELSRGLVNYRRWQTGAWREKGVLVSKASR